MRCTIRDLLWLTVLMAVAIGWWRSEQRKSEQAERLTHLRANSDDVVETAKGTGIYVNGDAERRQVGIEYDLPKRARPITPTGAKDAKVKMPTAKAGD
jgi:hypothetical protein